MKPSPIAALMLSKGVVLPERPLDLSGPIRGLGIRTSYAVVMTGRTGSTWLAGALEQVEGCGAPHEYFAEDTLATYARLEGGVGFGQVVLGVVDRYRTGPTFGFKINPTRLFWLGEHLDLAATFGGLGTRWIDMRRWNVVRQAHSFLRAKRSGVWHLFTDSRSLPLTPANPQIEASDQNVWKEVAGILRQERQADAFYAAAGIAPLRIFYEELHDSKAQVLIRVTRHLGIDLAGSDLRALKDTTAKLATAADERDEDAFVERHADAINAIMGARAGPPASWDLDGVMDRLIHG
jgi:LPS sulfotransferase NodH